MLIKANPERTRVFILFGAIIVIFIIQAVIRPGSVSFIQAMNTSRQAATLGLVVIGQALVILSGGIDLSVGASLTLANVVSVSLMNGQDDMFFPAIIITLLLTSFVGFVNGILTVKLRIAPFIATLCTLSIVEGSYLIYTGGAPRGSANALMRMLGTGFLFDLIPYVAFVWLVVALSMLIVLKYTTFGRKVYTVGTNAEVARLCGISVGSIRIIAYVLSGFFAGIAGLFMSGYIGTSSLGIGADYVNNTLTCVLIGGNAIAGGKGGILGIVLASFLVMLLFALLTMLNLGHAGRLVVQGSIIFIIMASNSLGSLIKKK